MDAPAPSAENTPARRRARARDRRASATHTERAIARSDRSAPEPSPHLFERRAHGFLRSRANYAKSVVEERAIRELHLAIDPDDLTFRDLEPDVLSAERLARQDEVIDEAGLRRRFALRREARAHV